MYANPFNYLVIRNFRVNWKETQAKIIAAYDETANKEGWTPAEYAAAVATFILTDLPIMKRTWRNARRSALRKEKARQQEKKAQ